MPPRPILETFKYGAVERFGRLQVSETNVKRDRAIRPKCSTAFAKRLPLLSKKQLLSFAAGEWLANIRCYAWLLLLVRATTIQPHLRQQRRLYPRHFLSNERCIALRPILLIIRFARRNSGEVYGIGTRFIASAAPDSSRAQSRTLETRRKVITWIALPLHHAPHDKMLPQLMLSVPYKGYPCPNLLNIKH